MTNIISRLQQMPVQSASAEASISAPAAAPSPTGSEEAAQSEAVTLSPEAQATTQLLGAARDASGVNQSTVEQICGALANGTYSIAPEDLAQAIVTVLKETN